MGHILYAREVTMMLRQVLRTVAVDVSYDSRYNGPTNPMLHKTGQYKGPTICHAS